MIRSHAQHHMAAEMVQTEGLQNSLFAYNALISGCTSGRGYDRAMGYFNDMVSRPTIVCLLKCQVCGVVEYFTLRQLATMRASSHR